MTIEETKDYIGIWVTADHQEDTGFTANGDFIDGVLHHAGMILYKEARSV